MPDKRLIMDENPGQIRVAYVIDKLVCYGGAQKILISLIRQLSRKQYQQTIYSLKDVVHPDCKRALTECGVDVKVVGKWQLLMTVGLARIIYDWLSWKPNIVVTMLFYSDVIGRSAAKIASVPVIISSIRGRNSSKKGWQFFLDRITARWVDKVVFNSKHVIPFAMQYEGVREDQIAHIPNGVNISPAPIDPVKKRQELGISKNTVVIGSVGRLHPEKGFSDLLRAFQHVQKQFNDSVLLLIGPGALLEPLTFLAKELNIAENVIFLGERTDVHELLGCLDVYVQTSLFEGMSNALMEAMAMGKAVVATAVGGTLELIEDGKTGWFVEPENVEMLTEKICYVLSHPEFAEKIGSAAAGRMRREFALEKMVNAYDRLFRGLIAKKLNIQKGLIR